MKKFFLSFLLIMIAFFVAGQPFEGKIIYVIKFKSKTTKMSSEQWDAMMGTSQEYFIKDGNYKSVTNGAMFQWQLYNNKENKIYSKLSTEDKVYWVDCGMKDDAIIKSKINKGVKEILENTCDELILNCKSGVQKYYYSSAFPADVNLFKNHKYGNWYDYLLKAHALPLKSIIETDQFIMESIAIKILPLGLDDNLFQLPKGVIVEKSP